VSALPAHSFSAGYTHSHLVNNNLAGIREYGIGDKRLPGASEIPESVDIQNHLTSIHVDEWLKSDVFKARWWFLLFLIIAAVVIWFISLDKSRLKEVCLFTALAFIIVLGLNEYGEELVLWDYPTDIIAIFPPLSSINLLILPLAYSLAYQHFRTTRSYMFAVLIITAVICFMIEPLLAWGDLFQLLRWHYSYNYPLFVAVALFLRYITQKVGRLTEKYRRQKGGQ
jgi:hypothetical protein